MTRALRLRPILVLLLATSAVALLGAPCKTRRLVIDTPVHGTFSNAGSVLVEGRALNFGDGLLALTVNGVSVLPLSAGEFSTTVSLDPGLIFNPILLEATTSDGAILRRRAVVIAGDGVNTGFVLDGDKIGRAHV